MKLTKAEKMRRGHADKLIFDRLRILVLSQKYRRNQTESMWSALSARISIALMITIAIWQYCYYYKLGGNLLLEYTLHYIRIYRFVYTHTHILERKYKQIIIIINSYHLSAVLVIERHACAFLHCQTWRMNYQMNLVICCKVIALIAPHTQHINILAIIAIIIMIIINWMDFIPFSVDKSTKRIIEW